MAKQLDNARKSPRNHGVKRACGDGQEKRSYNRRKTIVRRNALKHGLSIPVTRLPYFKNQIEAWHRALLNDLARNYTFPCIGEHSQILEGVASVDRVECANGTDGVDGVSRIAIHLDVPTADDALTDKMSIGLAHIPRDIVNITYEIAVQICEMRRIAEMKRLLSSERIGSFKNFSNNEILHLVTIVEGFIVPPNKSRIPFDDRAMSMLYRIFGIRRGNAMNASAIAPGCMTSYQIKRLAAFERYEERASIRMRKAVKRLSYALPPAASQK